MKVSEIKAYLADKADDMEVHVFPNYTLAVAPAKQAESVAEDKAAEEPKAE